MSVIGMTNLKQTKHMKFGWQMLG